MRGVLSHGISVTYLKKSDDLTYFCATLTPLPSPPRPNCTLQFRVFDDSDPPLTESPSPFVRSAWATLLDKYPGELPKLIDGIITYGYKIGFTGPHNHHLSKNLSTALLDAPKMTATLLEDLKRKRVLQVDGESPFIGSPLGFVPKPGGKLRRIHHLSHPRNSSTNDGIKQSKAAFRYETVRRVCKQVLQAGRGCYIMKRDWEAAFRTIPVSPSDRWLLGFRWLGQFYTECCLPFGLRTAPIIFNLFAEALHWILESQLGWELVSHYLDDIIIVIRELDFSSIDKMTSEFITLTDLLGIPCNDVKNEYGQKVSVLRYLLNTNTFEMSIPNDKITKIRNAIDNALRKQIITL